MPIDDYVAELNRTLTGPPGPKRDLVVEARDSLTDTADALEAEGLDRAEAERIAVAEFGPVPEIAPGYQAELTSAAGRRLGFLLFISVPITVLMWSVLWRMYPADDDVWASQPVWYSPVSRLLDIVQLAVGVYGGLVLLALGRGARWIRRPRLLTRSLALVVWISLPITIALAQFLTHGTEGASGLDVLPSALANLVTAAVWGLQVYGAIHCMRITRATHPRAGAAERSS
ncbi:permease prefix domain 1-containing protein [Nonomuraea sp. SYSU D8015]|uniref:permease prefix domain 1-containing protein n=1 Tax=Nonomuraea sp. SYSU D8015 TaxID=2593644 RepID=UPI001660B44C|nr:permease prefix domain 1-containing protein [Nonomuraea sp. SYSU D8015]